MRFVHAADIHLDSPLCGLENYPGAPVEQIRGASRSAFIHLMNLCLEEQVDFLVVAGDLFDSSLKDFHTALFVVQQFRRLESAGIPVYLIFGNHDSFQEMSRRTPWPANVHVFDHKRPQTFRIDNLNVALHGRSFPKREVLENLVPEYPEPLAGCFNIGILHTNANGSPNHDSYAPCSVPELIAKRYDYWALGHVHEHLVLHSRPAIVYSGNPQGRHARELGAKGAVLAHVTDGELTELEFREVDVLRWFRETVTLQSADGIDELYEHVRMRLRDVQSRSDGRFAAVRLEIEGRCAAHRRLVRDDFRQQVVTDLRALAGDFRNDLWIEKIKFRTRSPLDVDALRRGPDLIGELLRSIDATILDPAQLDALTTELQPLMTKVAADLQGTSPGEVIDFRDPQQLTEWVRDAERILLDRLVESAE